MTSARQPLQLGLHALVWVGDWTPRSAEHAISSTAALGFDLIEVPLLDPSTVDGAMTRRLLDEHGLGAACSLGLDPSADVSSEDPAVVARGRDLLGQAVDAAAEMGATDLCGVLYSVLAKYPAPLTDRSRAHVVESMAWLADRAAGSGLRVNLEVVNRYETNVVNTTADMLTLIGDTGADLGVHLDTYHMHIEENGMTEAVHQAVDAGRLRYVHVGESHRGYLGTGNVDFDTFCATLREVEYAGPVVFESFSSAVVHPTLSNQLAVWRNLWDDSEDLAKHAMAFLAERLR
ncbi:sugar phosphate isomerase/epimerase family protein [Nocardioides marmoribigeumensis]|jgi:D-psicose/D-tagatose/L-ribulose 3-epimerase|uniref:D-psicose/D-tagatose/L-ribulose 3-epimerase n=1 Tax=Nocardioides marmoribigeumensis TaxID=433649 RepID=A0ABU2BQF3_9ACTN|nr:sugar phosphate isomerase/epimerase family protein [Nocardioides marmoribigeumensis]MDR7360870.1 D-psicose/D-tagatose/L-ribulose 3-epimerase [Nocardioides marmoribigeumensis]